MAQDPAKWRTELNDAEKRELELAERARAAAVDQYKAVFSRLKNRCVKRLRDKAARKS